VDEGFGLDSGEIIMIHLRGQAPEGRLAAPETARMRGGHGGQLSQAGSLKSFAPCIAGLSVVLPMILTKPEQVSRGPK
jgi:hypothetical protein